MTDLYPMLNQKLHIGSKAPVADIDTMADDEETFQDATEKIAVASEMDLVSAIEEVTVGLHFLLNNKYAEAQKIAKPWADKSIYHAMALGSLYTFQAMMTFDQADIEAALEVLKSSADLCNRRRHRTTVTNNLVTKLVLRPNYNTYAEEEVHAEMCYAECLLFRALVTFIQDDNLMSFIKGGLRVRSCYQSYKECFDMLEFREWKNDTLKNQFKAGVLLGVGTFNLLISTLPGRVLKLLEFVGFSGNRELGVKYLEEGRNMDRCLRGPLCSIVIILYHTVIRYALGKGCQDLDYVGKVLKPLQNSYPKSTLIQFFAGRYENTRGNSQKAIQWLTKSLNTEVDWKKFQHFSHWELNWCYMLNGEFRKAIPHVEFLLRENSWSKSTYTYMKAAQLSMGNDCTDAEKKEITEMITKVPELKHHFSGKSIPLEKFFCKKADKFKAQNNWLLYPVYEMMYVWNYFILLKGKKEVLNGIIAKLDRSLAELKETKKDWAYFADNYCLATFLKGLCLRYMGTPLSAEECFKEVLKNQKLIKDDIYLPACAAMELGFICIETKNYPVALQYLELAKNEKAFFMEFRVHQGFDEIEAITGSKNKQTPTTPTSPTYRTFSDGEPLDKSATKL